MRLSSRSRTRTGGPPDERLGERRTRVLLVVNGRQERPVPAERLQRMSAGEEPRSVLFEQVLDADLLDEAALDGAEGVWARLYRLLPAFAAQAIEARRRARGYDCVVTWSERHSVATAAAWSIAPTATPHVAMLFWMSKPGTRWPLRAFRRGVDVVVTWSSVQRAFALRHLAFCEEDVVLVRHPVDERFYAPRPSERSQIFSAGSTMRDFHTLVAAVRTLDVPVLIAASTVKVLDGFRSREIDPRQMDLPPHVRVATLTPAEMRDAYAAARAVVVPLLPTDTDNGVNVILESMAMARPVIASRTEGQVDVIEDGVTGWFVPVGDAEALRERLEAVLADEPGADEVGCRARHYIEAHHSLEHFAKSVHAVVEALVVRGAPRHSGLRTGALRLNFRR